LAPDQAPEAEHADAFLLDQLMVEAPPELTVLGVALKVTTAGNGATVTVADWLAEPPSPVHVNSYSVVLVSAPVDQVPLVATAPVQPPDAVHAVAAVEDHVIVALPPLATVVGAAVIVTVGFPETTATWADCEVAPPTPVQVSVNWVLAVSGSVESVPLKGCVPLHPPDAMQLFASLAFQLKVAE
jgi:hypothetical protein